MNFLAHIFLSGETEEILIGNFIADSVRGNDFYKFTEGIRNGILLHRKIDEFTDRHPTVKLSKERLRPFYFRYSSVIVDIYYDHFLARDWHKFSSIPLKEYALDVYDLIERHLDIMPPRVHQFLPHMVADNWLYHYSTFEGIERVLYGMARRASFDSRMDLAIADLKRDYQYYEQEFHEFFPQLIQYVSEVFPATSGDR